MSVVRWIFFDATTSESYTFEINPNAGGSPGKKKNLHYQNTVAPDGVTLMFEGRDEVQTMRFSGTVLTQTHYAAFETWFDKRHQVKVTDDLGRQYWIYITSWQPTRVRSAMYPWKHTYDVEATILDVP